MSLRVAFFVMLAAIAAGVVVLAACSAKVMNVDFDACTQRGGVPVQIHAKTVCFSKDAMK
jgi:hypothetical protein